MNILFSHLAVRLKAAIVTTVLVALCSPANAQFTNGQNAANVLGQSNFTASKANTVAATGMSTPLAVAVDPTTGKLFVIDAGNFRVLRFSSANALLTGAAAEAVLGQPDLTTSNTNPPAANTFSNDIFRGGLAFDAAGNLFVSDCGNYRVLRFNNASSKPNGANADGVLGQLNLTTGAFGSTTQSTFGSQPQGLAVDAAGNLYVADFCRVLRFDNAASKPNGANADGVLGQSNYSSNSSNLSQNGFAGSLNGRFDVAVDATGNLYVADENNNRVLRFNNAASKPNGANADGVLGQPDFTSNNNVVTQIGFGGGLSNGGPSGVAIDGAGNLYVAIRESHRVMRFANAASLSNGAPADGVLGQPDFTSSSSGTSDQNLSGPTGVAVDASGNLFVADDGIGGFGNNRVVRFANAASLPNGSAATSVLGQATFFSDVANTLGASGFYFPQAVAVNPASGKVYVADSYNNRVLRFNSASAAANGDAAEAVLGQPDFVTATASTSQNGMSRPKALVVDATGNLYVADDLRVLRFNAADSKLNGTNADGVLGQVDFVSGAQGTTQNQMRYPTGLTVTASGTLFVADNDNNRVLRFDNAASKPNGANADGVLGQPDFTSNAQATTQNGMTKPRHVAVDGAGNLYVSSKSYYGGDVSNNRVLRFNNAASKPNGANADGVLGQPNFTSNAQAITQNGMTFPIGIGVDASGNLYVANTRRVLGFYNAASKPNGANADVVLGQANFTSASFLVTQNGLSDLEGIGVNPTTGDVFVCDYGSNRILRFNTSIGTTFTPTPISGGTTFNAVAGATSGAFITVGNGGQIRYTLDNGANWLTKPSGTSNTLLGIAVGNNFDPALVTSRGASTVQAPTALGTAISCGVGGTILRTTTGGDSWVNENDAIVPDVDLRGIAAADGIVAGKGTTVQAPTALGTAISCGVGGTILRSTDGGENWTVENSTGSDLNSVAVTNDFSATRTAKGTSGASTQAPTALGTAISCGVGGTILRSIDGGDTWTPITSGTTHTLNSVSIFGDAAARQTGRGASTQAPTALGTAISCGVGGTILRSIDGGQTWTPVSSGTTEDLHAVQMATELVGYISGDNGTVLRTTDAGQTWQNLSPATTEDFNGIFVQLSGVGIAVGTTGTAFTSLDGGGGIDLPLPVELTAFSGIAGELGVNLNWTTASEKNNAGFVLLRNGVFIADYQSDATLSGKGTTTQTSSYAYTDALVETGQTYTYALRSVDYSGTVHDYPQSVTVEVRGAAGQVYEYALNQNYPNPFNPQTVIGFTMKNAGVAAIKIYDVLGRVVVSERLNATAGVNQYRFNGSKLTSGVYFYQLTVLGSLGSQAAGFSQTRKMLMVK